MKKQVDFTEGNIVWAIVRFSIPLILGELLQNLYNSVDALVAGNLVDQNALAAVTVCGVIANLVVNFFNAMSIGSNVVVAKANGSGERERLCHTIRVTFSFGVVLGVLLSLFGILLSPQLLRLAGAQESYLRDALIYLRIYLAGLMFTVIYNNAAGILRALGRADIPFRILVVSCGMNIALDLLFVSAFDMGIAGVGVATVLSQAVSVAMAYRTISREIQSRCLDLREMYREGGRVIGEVLRIGEESVTVLHTPGHTGGSVCFLVNDGADILTGDTLFDGSYGRCDLWGGDAAALHRSLVRLSNENPAARIHPGHGEDAGLGDALEMIGII